MAVNSETTYIAMYNKPNFYQQCQKTFTQTVMLVCHNAAKLLPLLQQPLVTCATFLTLKGHIDKHLLSTHVLMF